MNDVWYAGYGSNLSKQRFFCYLKGGTPLFGKKENSGCGENTILPKENQHHIIHYPIYFALPENRNATEGWGKGGVAFMGDIEDKKENTFSRIWKITHKQYEQVWDQEGRSAYGKEVLLGEKDGLPILTITHPVVLKNILPPSEPYLKTIITGLMETFEHLDEEMIATYLLSKIGIKEYMEKAPMISLIRSVM